MTPPVAPWETVPHDLDDYINQRRTSECSTFIRETVANVAPTAGAQLGGLAISRSPLTYTQIRCFVGSVLWVATTDFYLAAWDINTLAVRAVTGNLAATINASAAHTAVQGAFTGALTLADGESVILGLAPLGQTAGNVKGTNIGGSAIGAMPPAINWSNAYVGGIPGPMAGAGSANLPWVELVP